MRGSTAGLSDKLRTGSGVLRFLDALFSALVVAPAVVGYWRSVWTLMDVHVLPETATGSALVSVVVGSVGHVALTLGQEPLKRAAERLGNGWRYVVFSRVYTVVFALVCVNGWRGPWNLMVEYDGVEVVAVTMTVGVVALTVMRGLRNVSAVPCAVVEDGCGPEEYFGIPTMFRVSLKEKNLFFYILDCLFSVFVVGTLVVFIWRGVWALLDLHLFPQNEEWSAFASLIIGYACVAVAFLMQPLMKKICEHLKGVFRILSADIFVLFSLFGTVNVWRGIWNLLNLYFIPDNVELSCWIAHWVCLSLLLVLRCSNSLLVRGVYIDGEEPAGECVVFPCCYLRLLVHEEQLKKLKAKVRPEPDGGGVFVVELNHHAGKKDAEVEGEAKKKGAKEDGVA